MGTNIRYQAQFNGYENFRDITNMPVTKLAPGTRNVVIPSGEKVEVRGGIDYFGVAGTQGVNTNTYWTLAHRIHSRHDTFVNAYGDILPFRVFYEGRSICGDVIEVWYPIFSGGVKTNQKKWYQINETFPSTPLISKHRYYFAEQFDTLNLTPRVVFTFGSNAVGSYSGGVSNITAIIGSTILTNPGETWAQHGFIPAPNGVPTIVIRGTAYTVTSGWNTNALTLTSVAGIVVDDVAWQQIQQDVPSGSSSVVLDVCATLNNQIYYLSFTSRNYFVSWNRDQIQSITVPSAIVTSALNDATFSGTYSGTINHNFTATIDSVNPNFQTEEFFGTGTSSIKWDTSAISIVPDTLVTFEIDITSIYDMTLNGVNVIDFAPGNVIVGGTSGATATVVTAQGNSGPALFQQVISLGNITGIFQAGETITTIGTTATGTLIILLNESRASYYRNNILLSSNSVLASGFIPGPNNLAIIVDTSTQQQPGDRYVLQIRIGGRDTFSWALDGITQGSKIPITGAAQLLSLGISVTFAHLTGHDVGDAWTITAFPTVNKSWIQFWYSVPSRFPGEGYTGLLDSNGWSLKPQEKYMYAISQSGQYYNLGTQLSSSLLNESVITDRLKSEPQNKPLFPYLISYIRNQISVISQDKTYDTLGRIKLVELPQMKSISDEVRTDFVNADWEDGDILYFLRRKYFSVPRDGVLYIHDEYKNYWQAPNTFGRRIGLLSIIDNQLVAHSYERNESYILFTESLNDLGEFPIDTKIVFPYDSGKSRFTYKGAAAIGFEGYMQGKPDIDWLINAGVGGCMGQRKGKIQPWVTKQGLCIPEDLSSLGKSSLGYHGLGNSPTTVPPSFMYIKPFNNIGYYKRNIEISCKSLEQNWSLVALGTDLADPSISNEGIVDPNPLV